MSSLELKIKLLQNELRILQGEHDDLQSKYEELRTLVTGNMVFPIEWELPPAQIIVLKVLYKHRHLSKEQVFAAIYGLRRDVEIPTLKIIDVYVSHMRKTFRKNNIPVNIHTVWARGYELDDASREYLKQFDHTSNLVEETI